MYMSQEEISKLPNLCETHYEEGMNVGYRYFQTINKEISYPFGFGMSYTDFEYSDAKVQRKGDKYIASVLVKNIGNYQGKEAVQLYITAPESNLEKPVYELKAFGKTKELQPGESQRVYMEFTNYDLASYDESLQAYVTDAGDYTARFAGSAADIRLNKDFKAKHEIVKCHDVLKMK